jgi:hypothetical protein
MTLPTYTEIAATFNVPICPGFILPLCGWGEMHESGIYSEIDGHMHWAPRRSTRAGIYRFLWHLARSMVDRPGKPHWQQHYETLRMVPVLADLIHVRLPRSLSERDRAQLRAALVTLPRTPEVTEAMRWAQR